MKKNAVATKKKNPLVMVIATAVILKIPLDSISGKIPGIESEMTPRRIAAVLAKTSRIALAGVRSVKGSQTMAKKIPPNNIARLCSQTKEFPNGRKE